MDMTAGQNPGGGNIDWGSILNGAGGLYGAFSGAGAQQGTSNAAQAGYGMARNAYNPSLFGLNGVGGTGFSMSSPSGGPGSISTNLGAFNPVFGNLGNLSGNAFGNINPSQLAGLNSAGMGQINNPLVGQAQGAAGGLIGSAAGGASGAYNNALQSILGQLNISQGQTMQGMNDAQFQRGQMGTTGGALQTRAMAQGFGLADLNAITAAQNQGLNFFNSNLQGAGSLNNIGLGTLGMGSNMLNTGTGNLMNLGLGGIQGGGNLINMGNQQGQLPLAFSQLYGNQGIGATNSLANMLRGANGVNAPATGYGSLGNAFGAGAQGGIGGLINSGQNLYNGIGSLFGGGAGAGVTGAVGSDVFGGMGPLASFGTDTGASAVAGGGIPDWLAGFGGPSAAGGEAAGAGSAAGVSAGAGADVGGDLAGASFDLPAGYASGGGAAAGGAGGAAGAGLGLAGNVALPLAMFAGMNALFNKQSSYTPGQWLMDAQGQLSNPNTPQNAAAVDQFMVDQWNPSIGNFNQIPGFAGSTKPVKGVPF